MYLLDTNAISELRKVKTGKAHQGFIEWLYSIQPDTLYINTIVLMELKKGIFLKQRKDPKQAQDLQIWLDTIIRPTFAHRTLNIDENTIDICAKLHVPNKRPENDAWIGAMAIAYNMTLVTRNVKDYAGLPVKILNPFNG